MAGIDRRSVALWAPDRNDEYLFYQTLVGVWPAELAQAPLPDTRAGDARGPRP